MAAEDQESRTEAPTGERIAEARAEGDVPMGHDVVLVAGVAAGLATLIAVSPMLRSGLTELIAASAGSVDRTPFGQLPGLAVRPILAVVAVCAAGGAASMLATLVQTGGGVWPERAGLDLSRLFNLGRLSQIFEREFLLDLLISLAKVAAVVGAAWWALAGEVGKLPNLLRASPADALATTFRLLASAFPAVLVAMTLVAGAELLHARHRFFKKLRMTKEEVKREVKEENGDPLLKGKRKQRHRDLLRNRARIEVPRADALVVNPTHVAVAIRYRRDEGRAPRVTAKGKGALAEYMRELARENGIPIYQDIPLARLLYRKVKVGREIPAQTYQAVAAVLAFVYRLTGRRAGTGVGGRA